MRTTRADDFKQCSHLLESTSLMKDVKKLSSNCSHELLYFGWMPACASVTFLVIAECLTQKGLWPVGRGGQTGLRPPRQIYYCCAVKPWSCPTVTTWLHTGGPKLQLAGVVWLSTRCCTTGDSGLTYVRSWKWLFLANQSRSPFPSPRRCRLLSSANNTGLWKEGSPS